mmetsp:Transcript_8490/g.13913  ORF Transcript_8490/g.13913 Transcript_8490/m.13913 type:complete len:235 (+) Transcript_8490:161-865(+)
MILYLVHSPHFCTQAVIKIKFFLLFGQLCLVLRELAGGEGGAPPVLRRGRRAQVHAGKYVLHATVTKPNDLKRPTCNPQQVAGEGVLVPAQRVAHAVVRAGDHGHEDGQQHEAHDDDEGEEEQRAQVRVLPLQQARQVQVPQGEPQQREAGLGEVPEHLRRPAEGQVESGAVADGHHAHDGQHRQHLLPRQTQRPRQLGQLAVVPEELEELEEGEHRVEGVEVVHLLDEPRNVH